VGFSPAEMWRGSRGPEKEAGVVGETFVRQPAILLTLALTFLVPFPAHPAADAEAELLSQQIRVLVIGGQRVRVKGELVIRDGVVLFRNHHDVLHSIPLEEIDLGRTMRANPNPEFRREQVAAVEPEPVIAKRGTETRSAEIATMQAISTVGLAAREGEPRSPVQLDAALPARWTFFTGLTSLADTNIDNRTEGSPDVGVIPSVGVNYRHRGKRTSFTGSYTAAFHSYSRSEQWNRTSHNLNGWLEPRWKGRVRSATGVEIAIKGTNEDRDLSDRYSLTQRFRLRTTDGGYLRLTAGYRLKHYDDQPANDEKNPHVGLDYRQRLGSGAQWGLGYRVEENFSDSDSRVYRRDTASADLTVPLSAEAFIGLGLRRYDQHYPHRMVLVDGAEVPRADERWLGSVSLNRRFFASLGFAFEYQYAARFSNDPERESDGHSVGVSLIRFW
jgi:hypothetical protein